MRSFPARRGVNYGRVKLGVDCGGIVDEGNPPPGPAEVKTAPDSGVSIGANPGPSHGFCNSGSLLSCRDKRGELDGSSGAGLNCWGL